MQLAISTRQTTTYGTADDYRRLTGRVAPWNPDQPERHWETLAETGPFYVTPTVTGSQPRVFAGDCRLVNIPHAPVVAPWSIPSVAVTANGSPMTGLMFCLQDEAEALIAEINAAAIAGGFPQVGALAVEDGPSAYIYGGNEQRRYFVFRESSGRDYVAGERLAQRNAKGQAIIETTYGTNGPEVSMLPPGSWAYGENGWYWVPSEKFDFDYLKPRVGGVAPRLVLQAGESIVWNGPVPLVQTAAVSDEDTLGPLSRYETEMLRIARDTLAAVQALAAAPPK